MMIVIKLTGGLGNQMFQYAAGLSAATRKNTRLLLDISYFKYQPKKDTPRFFSINSFNISYTTTTSKRSLLRTFFKKIRNRIRPNSGYVFDVNLLNRKYLIGEFQNENYFKDLRDKLINEFSLKKESTSFKIVRDDIIASQSVSIHIRRSDYESNISANKYHGLLDIEYYKQAVLKMYSIIGKDFTLYVFSDDINWARENVTLHTKIKFVSDNSLNEQEELILMSICKHNIIANSTFSWWSAWLNKNKDKIIIAPRKWINGPESAQPDIIPSTWIKI